MMSFSSSRKSVVAALLAAAAVLWSSTRVTTQQAAPPNGLPAEAIRQIAAFETEKASRTPAQRKISSHLLRAERMRRGEPVAPGVAVTRQSVTVDADGRVEVDIRSDVTPNVLDAIAVAGGTIVNSHPDYRSVRARIPLAAIEAMAALPEVRSISPAEQPISRQLPSSRAAVEDPSSRKVNTSQGDTAHRAALARSFYGVTGAGVGIGVISDGVSSLASRQASGDVPAVTVLAGQAGSGDEGTAMLEIVSDLAPGSPLFFATADGGQAQFASNIQSLCAAGARVIVDDQSYPGEAVFQDGIVSQGVNAAVGSGCLYFSAAGNAGNLTHGLSGVWEGDVVAAASNPPGITGTAHNFGGGANSNVITQDPPRGIALQWSDPLGASTNDYDLYLFNSTLTIIFDVSDNSQTGTQDPYETIDSAGFNDLNNRLVIVRRSGAARYLHMDTMEPSGRLAIATSGRIADHAGAANALAVAAVNVGTASGGAFTGGAANPVTSYSSDGRRRIFYTAGGAAITPGNFLSTGGTLLQKPDLAAADCVSTATHGFSPFCGTSAAAPHAAAIAALVLQAAGGPSSLTLAQMRAVIAARALDIESPGVDRDSGPGIMDALGVVGRVHPMFTDSSLIPGLTLVKAVHLSQLRDRVNAQRIRCGLAALTWTDGTIVSGMTPVKAAHITDLRNGLNAAYSACGMSPPPYTDDPSLSGQPVKAAHFTELRNAVIALE